MGNRSKKNGKDAVEQQRVSTSLPEHVALEDAGELYNSAQLFKEIESLISKRIRITLNKNQISLLHNLVQSLPVKNHIAYPEALNSIAMGGALIESSEYEKAENWLVKASVLADKVNSSFLRFNLCLTQAELYFARDDNESGVIALTQAMSIGRKKNYLDIKWWRSSAMCRLCIKALENNVEVDYVQQLIKIHKLFPDSPPFHLDNWPWHVMIYTLGRFSVLLDGKHLSINDKGKSKPVELLKVLIAMGGRDVSELRICEALWPDAEGDKAHSSFTSTLSRLRKLLGSDLLIFRGGQLSLNDHLCWLDVWAYERSLGALESALSAPDAEQIINIEKKIHRLFGLYHGFFMEKEPPLGWMLPLRERLQIKLLRVIKRLISFFSSKGRCKRVITLYEKARELEPLSEEYYRGLMRCHAALGNEGEALAIYENCRSILGMTFNIQPSDKTMQLFDQIKAGDKKELKRACTHCARGSD